MMETSGKSVLTDAAETRLILPNLLPPIYERSPLLDRRQLRSSASKSVSVFRLQKPNRTRPLPRPLPAKNLTRPLPAKNLKPTIAERPLLRSRSAPLHRHTSSSPVCPNHAPFRSSPLYRVNGPAVRFDERLLPERMNYGIAGYNTSRPRNFSGRASSECSKRGVIIRTRPRSVQILKLWTRKLRVRMIRSACSRFMMRFRRRR